MNTSLIESQVINVDNGFIIIIIEITTLKPTFVRVRMQAKYKYCLEGVLFNLGEIHLSSSKSFHFLEPFHFTKNENKDIEWKIEPPNILSSHSLHKPRS